MPYSYLLPLALGHKEYAVYRVIRSSVVRTYRKMCPLAASPLPSEMVGEERPKANREDYDLGAFTYAYGCFRRVLLPYHNKTVLPE